MSSIRFDYALFWAHFACFFPVKSIFKDNRKKVSRKINKISFIDGNLNRKWIALLLNENMKRNEKNHDYSQRNQPTQSHTNYHQTNFFQFHSKLVYGWLFSANRHENRILKNHVMMFCVFVKQRGKDREHRN